MHKPEGYRFEEKTFVSRFDKSLKSWSAFNEESTVLKTPEEMNFKRSAIAHILFSKDVEDKNAWNSIEKIWFHMVLSYTMRPDVTDNLWFIESDGKLFIRDFNCAGGGVCCFVALNQSNENYTCKQIGKIEKITAEQATAIVKTTGTRLIFGKVETNATNGNIESFGVCV